MSATFDPNNHLRQLRGKGGTADYLDVKWRLVWLRAEHPNAAIVTEKMAGGIEHKYAEFKATVTIPNGGTATGWGSETVGDFGDFLEKAETKAVGRALAMLGYGTQFVGYELDEGERIVDSPVATPPKVRDWPDEQLLAVVQDDTRDPVRRIAAGRIYVERAHNPLDVNARMRALGALPQADREALRAGALARLQPAGVNG